MTEFHDFLINSEIEELLGWSRKATQLDTVVLEASEWGELKRKIDKERKNTDILVFKGENDELTLKATEDSRIDIILYEAEETINHVIAEKACENAVNVGFNFQNLYNSDTKYKILSVWKDSLQILEKFDTKYLITTNAEDKEHIRPPRDLAALVEELGGNGGLALKEGPKRILENVEERKSGKLGSGVEKV